MAKKTNNYYPSIDVIFPLSDLWLLPYLKNSCNAVLCQRYPKCLIQIYISYYYKDGNEERIGQLANYCKTIGAYLIINKWKDTDFSRGQAFNAAIRCGCREVIACIDADVVIHKSTFDKARPFVNSGKLAVISVGRTSDPPSSKVFHINDISDRSWDEYTKKCSHRRDGVGNILIPRKVMEDINGYDERYYGWGGGDTELYNRVSRKYGSVYLIDKGCPKALHQYHKKTQTRESMLTSRNRGLLISNNDIVQNNDSGWGCVPDLSNNVIPYCSSRKKTK